MEPVDTEVFNHGQPAGLGILLTNLGTPEAPTASALRPYLKQFLSDRRVVDLPRWLWWPILNLIVLNVRPRKSAAAYARVWTKAGSPLLVHTAAQARALRGALQDPPGDRAIVEFGFRYGRPSIAAAVESLQDRGARKLLVLPLFPQYNGPTTGSTFDALADCLKTRRWVPELRMVTHYHDHPRYIAAVAGSIKAHWGEHGRAERLLLSYHGIPERYRDSGDPYYCQCLKTTRLVAEALGLAEGEYLTAFQSRFGREEWIKPYTDEVLTDWARAGVGSVQAICPGFAADCLETLEEVALQYRDLFLESGGRRFEYIPALNSGAAQTELMTALVRDHLGGWPPPDREPEVARN